MHDRDFLDGLVAIQAEPVASNAIETWRDMESSRPRRSSSFSQHQTLSLNLGNIRSCFATIIKHKDSNIFVLVRAPIWPKFAPKYDSD